MQVLRHLETLGAEHGPLALAIGFFDGVHRGHQRVLDRARAEAAVAGGAAWALTFDEHPRGVVGPAPPPLLTCNRHKLLLLKRAGLDGCLILPFTKELAAMPAEDFARHLCATLPGLRHIAVGAGWRFGRGGQGTTELLSRIAAERGIGVGVEAPVLDGDAPVSSTRVRAALLGGRIEEACRLLGRPPSLLGEVVRGQAFGRTIGYPTANLVCANEVLPPCGIYAVHAAFRGAVLDGVLSHGTRPTLGGDPHRPVQELHLLEFSDEVYGEEIEVFLVRFLREQIRFPSIDALRERIAGDVTAAREILADAQIKESLYTLCYGAYIPPPKQTETGKKEEGIRKRSGA